MIFDRAAGIAAAPQSRASFVAIDAWVSAATVREIVRVAARARASFRESFWAAGGPSLGEPLRARQIAAVAPRWALPAFAALASLHRSGYVREAALTLLASVTGDDRVIPFLLLRADDIIPSIRDAAEAAVAPRLAPESAPALARSLRLVTLLAGRTRGARCGVSAAISALLTRPACRTVLVRASERDDDPAARLAAFELRLGVEPIPVVVASALRDRETSVQAWAARVATANTTSEADRRALLHALAASPSPMTRLLGLRSAARLDPHDDAPLERAVLDPQSVVRYAAHTSLRARRPDRPFGAAREVALAVLADEAAPRARLVGALGSLSDVGLAADLPAIARFLGDARASVRREASRTHEVLIARA